MNLSSNDFESVYLKKGDILFKKGEKSKHCYIVKQGYIACFSLSKDKRVVPLFSINDHGLIGETDLFKDNPTYSHFAVAMSDVEAIKVPNKEIKTYLRSASDWITQVFQDLGDKINNTCDMLVEHKIVDERLNGGQLFTDEEEVFLKKTVL